MKDVGIMYHASSPDEVALVQWTEKVGITLIFRDIKNIKLKNPFGQIMNFEILEIFPFSSETKMVFLSFPKQKPKKTNYRLPFFSFSFFSTTIQSLMPVFFC